MNASLNFCKYSSSRKFCRCIASRIGFFFQRACTHRETSFTRNWIWPPSDFSNDGSIRLIYKIKKVSLAPFDF